MEQGTKPLDYSVFKRLMTSELCANTDVIHSHNIGRHSVEHIQKALHNPGRSPSILVDTSRYMMSISPFYMRLVNYFAKMGFFNYNIDTYDIKQKNLDKDKYLDSYNKLCFQFEKMNIKHEMVKAMPILLTEDLFCGLFFEDNTDFFIYRVDNRLCKIAQIQDGVYNFKVDLSCIDATRISSYPDYFKQEYLKYQKGERKNHWYVPPTDKQICLKFNETQPFIMPFIISLVGDIFDLDVYRKLKLQKARVDNYKAIVVEIPIDESAVDKPLLSEPTISVFAELNKANMPEDVGLLHVLGNAESVSFKDNSNNTNNLSDAITNLYDSAGVSSQVFNSGSTATAVKMSIENDSAFIYSFYRQCERYFNRFIKLRKFNKPNYKFAMRIHNSTIFNCDLVAESFLKASQHGLPFKIDYGVSMGSSPARIMGALTLENEVLALHEKFIPLSTSFTTSGDDISNGGRPTNVSKGIPLDDSGEATEDGDGNDR